jgi:tetratricopeptide (TPR) repeat protein/DNA-binding CsgD family transcriptional regulator
MILKYTKKPFLLLILHTFCISFISFSSWLYAQNETSKNWEIPQEIQVTTIEEGLYKKDSILQSITKLEEKAKILCDKGQLLLQAHRIKESKQAYQLAKDIKGNNTSKLTIKILAGLGEIADLEDNSIQANTYFSEAYTKAKELKSITGLLWILFHKGNNYITPELFSESELEALKKFARWYLYSKPQLTLAASNWIINHHGKHIKFVESAHIFAGVVYRDWGQFDKALDEFYKAAEVQKTGVYGGRTKYGPQMNIAAIYDMQGEREKSLQMLRKIKKDAKNDGDDWGLAYALKDIGITLMQDEEYKAAIPYFDRCIPVMQKLKDIRGEGVCYANLSDIFLKLENYEKSKENISKALKLLKASNYDHLYASTLLTKASLYEKLGRWEDAKNIADDCLVMLKRINGLEQIIYAYQVYINYYTHKNDAAMVQKYADSILEVNQQFYKKSRLFESENLKVRYETEKKEVQLGIQKKLNIALQEEASLHKWLRNTMFFMLLLSVVVLLLFFNRYKLQHKLVSEREKRNRLEKEQLQETMNHKQRELTSLTLQMLKKNELLQELKQNVNVLERKSTKDTQEEVKKLKRMLQSQNRLDQDWSTFKVHFDGVHPNFFEKLAQHGNLTPQDVRHSSYIKMGLATKEIAQLMNISASSVQMARYRLKKKLSLQKEDDVYTFINSL